MKLSEIHIRDPFILPEGGKYYLYGTRGGDTWGEGHGFDTYISDDLENWDGPHTVFSKTEDFWADRNYWAPEVHKYHGRFYMFASFKSPERCRGTQILISDSPRGPFLPHSDGPVTPSDWECLDGTLYIDKNGVPYMVFCHEWLQVKDGEMCCIRLSEDLKNAVGDARVMFRASEPQWADKGAENFVTDGPFLFRSRSGELKMLWSSHASGEYVQAVAVSDNGEIDGKWIHPEKPLSQCDGGHGMLFTDYDGSVKFTMHKPNIGPLERPVIMQASELSEDII